MGNRMISWRTVGLGLFGLLAGCATPKGPPKTPDYIFFPAPPAERRLQFLASYSSEADLAPRGGRSKFANFVLGKGPTEKPIIKPYGMALYGGKLYVVDTIANVVEVLDLRSQQMQYFSQVGQGQFQKPINITIDRDGTRYITDTQRGQVVIYGADDSYVGAIGKENEMRPGDVAVTTNRLYVADISGHAVRVYDKTSHQLLFTMPRQEREEAKLFSPTNLALDPQGRLYVSDTGAFRVQQYDAEGNYLQTIGRQGDAPGEFARPKGLAVDRLGRLYVVDAATQVVQIFDDQGKLLMFFGDPRTSVVPLDLPAKVIIDYEHVDLFRRYAAPDFELEYLVLVSNQYGNNKVAVYGFGHGK